LRPDWFKEVKPGNVPVRFGFHSDFVVAFEKKQNKAKTDSKGGEFGTMFLMMFVDTNKCEMKIGPRKLYVYLNFLLCFFFLPFSLFFLSLNVFFKEV